MLLAAGKSGRTGIAMHGEHDGLGGLRRAVVIADADAVIEAGLREVASGRVDAGSLQFLEALPVLNRNIGVDDGDFFGGAESFFLFGRQFVGEIRNYGVPA